MAVAGLSSSKLSKTWTWSGSGSCVGLSDPKNLLNKPHLFLCVVYLELRLMDDLLLIPSELLCSLLVDKEFCGFGGWNVLS